MRDEEKMMGLFHPLLLSLWLVSSTVVDAVVVPRQVTIIEGNPQAGASKCGRQPNGAVYSCPSREPCCHPNGYCVGSDESYCFVAEACQARYSAKSNHCQTDQGMGRGGYADGGNPDDPAMPVSDGTYCGLDGANQLWGACPNVKGYKCCSARYVFLGIKVVRY